MIFRGLCLGAAIVLAGTLAVAQDEAIGIKGERLLFCPTVNALREVAANFTVDELASGRMTAQKVKAVVAGCGVSNELALLGKSPKTERKRAVSKDGQPMFVVKGVGGRRIIVIR
ncbi:hypothetical protein [Roseobacter sp. A03A-229]